MTKYYKWTNKINEKELNICKSIIESDGTIVFPTETVYGIGANALSKIAVENIYKAKGRPSDNPLIVHVADKEMLFKLVDNVNSIEEKLIESFMPGPFTLILKKKDFIPDIVTASLDTVGIRMPSNNIARMLIKIADVPIAAPSANISGRPSGTQVEDIKEELWDKVDVIIDGGITDIGLESTVVKVIDGIPTILRPGKVTKEDIEKVIGIARIDSKLLKKIKENEKVESPGMKYKHYAPNKKCILITGNDEEQIKKINKLSEINKIGVIGFSEHKEKIKVNKYLEIGKKNNLEEISKNMFTILRKADQLEDVELIAIEAVEENGLGLAILNRLIRACEYNVI